MSTHPAAIITGAGSGIGRASALLLAQRGFALGLVGRTHAPLQRLQEEIRAGAHAPATICVVDVSVDAQVDAMVAQVLADHGRIDALINAAGSAPAVSLATLSTPQWHDILNSNLSSAFFTTRAVWPVMQRQFQQACAAGTPAHEARGGTIVNISSMAAKDPFPTLGIYGAAKAALNMLTLTTAREGHAVGIRAVAIAPAAVDTPMLHKFLDGKTLPDGAMLAPEDVAIMIADALTGSLRYCSGDTLYIHRHPA
jgi:NAD(P)-dependent dehydrogenase (short-subunit alcohol dehydrogenase family)